MADEKSRGAGMASGGMNIDSKLVRALAELLDETGLTEIEVEDGDRKIKVARQGAPMTYSAMPAPAPAAAGVPAPAAGAEPAAPIAPTNAVRSPMVGTAYLSAEPGGAPFVTVGSTVKAGETVLIVEAMKVMNPITAPSAGTVKEILVDNAQPVEFDQPLIVIA
ncbi:acetyl-CoA carboxylase biotin carboxyl carrier protein [Parablastomonas sp. CN1-191]|uniref:acetyl-CoA carboxylase biotin carboxyl carrier protein n=1 Tax=Parablastomonas sp. CN1-191 TaxID=3400908 RepID=UPI003BF7A333